MWPYLFNDDWEWTITSHKRFGRNVKSLSSSLVLLCYQKLCNGSGFGGGGEEGYPHTNDSHSFCSRLKKAKTLKKCFTSTSLCYSNTSLQNNNQMQVICKVGEPHKYPLWTQGNSHNQYGKYLCSTVKTVEKYFKTTNVAIK
jgi:hypothetical protein